MELFPTSPHRENLRDTGEGKQSLSDNPVRLRSEFDRIDGLICVRRIVPHSQDHDLPHNGGDGRQLRFGVFWQPIHHHGQAFVDDLACRVDIRTKIELDIDNGHTNRRSAPNSLHAVGTIDCGFDWKGDAALNFLRSHPGRLSHDDDPRPIQVRKYIDWQLRCDPQPVRR